MIKNIIQGYGHLISSILKILSLLLVCIAAGAAFVFPLWKFATDLPGIYTITVLVLMAVIFVILAVKKIKNAGLAKSLVSAAKFFIIAGGLVFSVYLVMKGMRFLAIPVIILMIVLYGLCAFGIKVKSDTDINNETESEA